MPSPKSKSSFAPPTVSAADRARLAALRPPFVAQRGDLAFEIASVAKAANSEPPNLKAMYEISRAGLMFRQKIVERYLRERIGAKIDGGPFAGMRYLDQAAGSLLAPKLLGTYEAELHEFVASVDRYKRCTVIGSAEGYYAVGFALKFPKIEIAAYDIDPRAQSLCQNLVRLNDVGARVTVHGLCSAADIARQAAPDRLFFIDIEGGETDLLRAVPAAALAKSDFLIETHPTPNGCTANAMLEIFEKSHEVSVIWQVERDTVSHPLLQGMGQLDRFLAAWEGRGPEPWLYCRAR